MKEGDRLMASLNIVKILSDFRGFDEWLRQYHEIADHKPFLEGYKYLIAISIQLLIEILFNYDPFGLKEDRTLARAHFVGRRLDDIPNSCEKTTLCKNIWLLTKNIRKAQSWDEMMEEELRNVTKLLPEIIDDYAETKLSNKKEALKAVTMFYAYIFLIDTSRGRPRAALGSFFDEEPSPTFLEHVFDGYAYGLQYLWYKLLSRKEFENSPLKDLHRSEEVFGKEYQEYVDMRFSYDEEPENSDNDFRKRVFHKWLCLDGFFKKVRSDVIWPMERKTYKPTTDLDSAVFNLKKVDRLVIKELLIPVTGEPEYLGTNDQNVIVKKLDTVFYWYPILLDSAEALVSSRTVEFIAILKGLAQIFEEEIYDDKILVKIIKHPISENKHDITFAILVGYQGSIVDDSRWRILFDCATDYSGAGKETYQRICNSIKGLGEKVELETNVIAKNDFMIYLREKNVSDIENADVYKLKTKFADYAGKARGKLFEYAVYKWIRSHSCFEYVDSDLWINGEQIDCYGKKDDIIELFECKISLHSVENTIKQLERKSRAIKQKYHNCKVLKNVAIFEDLSPDRIEKLKQKKICTHRDFKNKIRTDRAFDGFRREMLAILDITLSDTY